MIRGVDALVLWTPRLAEAAAFYRALGLPLEEERHDDGPVHFACELGPVHFALYASPPGQAPGRTAGGATQLGFRVESLERALAAARAAGAPVVVEPQEVPWGRRVVVLDPDGRAVELNEAPPG